MASQETLSERRGTKALHKYMKRFAISPPLVSQRTLEFEHRRPQLLRECIAEATGVFFYV